MTTTLDEGRVKDWLTDMQWHAHECHRNHCPDHKKGKEDFLKKYPGQGHVYDSTVKDFHQHESHDEETVNELSKKTLYSYLTKNQSSGRTVRKPSRIAGSDRAKQRIGGKMNIKKPWSVTSLSGKTYSGVLSKADYKGEETVSEGVKRPAGESLIFVGARWVPESQVIRAEKKTELIEVGFPSGGSQFMGSTKTATKTPNKKAAGGAGPKGPAGGGQPLSPASLKPRLPSDDVDPVDDPVKLNPSEPTPVIFNPTMQQSQNDIGDVRKDIDLGKARRGSTVTEMTLKKANKIIKKFYQGNGAKSSKRHKKAFRKRRLSFRNSRFGVESTHVNEVFPNRPLFEATEPKTPNYIRWQRSTRGFSSDQHKQARGYHEKKAVYYEKYPSRKSPYKTLPDHHRRLAKWHNDVHNKLVGDDMIQSGSDTRFKNTSNESINELSNKTLISYAQKSLGQLIKPNKNYDKRAKGYSRAIQKVGSRNEMTSAKLGNYIQKAQQDRRQSHHDWVKAPFVSKIFGNAGKLHDRIGKRDAGIRLAVAKRMKEPLARVHAEENLPGLKPNIDNSHTINLAKRNLHKKRNLATNVVNKIRNKVSESSEGLLRSYERKVHSKWGGFSKSKRKQREKGLDLANKKILAKLDPEQGRNLVNVPAESSIINCRCPSWMTDTCTNPACPRNIAEVRDNYIRIKPHSRDKYGIGAKIFGGSGKRTMATPFGSLSKISGRRTLFRTKAPMYNTRRRNLGKQYNLTNWFFKKLGNRGELKEGYLAGKLHQAIGPLGMAVVKKTAEIGALAGGLARYKFGQYKARKAASADAAHTSQTNTQGPWGTRPKTPTVPSIGTPLKPHVSPTAAPAKANTNSLHTTVPSWTGGRPTSGASNSAEAGQPSKGHSLPQPGKAAAAPGNEPQPVVPDTPLKLGKNVDLRNKKFRNPKMTALKAQHAAPKAANLAPNKVPKIPKSGKLGRAQGKKLVASLGFKPQGAFVPKLKGEEMHTLHRIIAEAIHKKGGGKKGVGSAGQDSEGDEHPVYVLKKSMTLGSSTVKHKNGEKTDVPSNVAAYMLHKYINAKNIEHKERMVRQMWHSRAHFQDAFHGRDEPVIKNPGSAPSKLSTPGLSKLRKFK